MADQTLLFAYVQEAPEVPKSHPTQRWFSWKNLESTGLDVCRRADRDVAGVGVSFSREQGNFTCQVTLSPYELRRAAATLLSAALDIEQNPSGTLMAAIRAANAAEVA